MKPRRLPLLVPAAAAWIAAGIILLFAAEPEADREYECIRIYGKAGLQASSMLFGDKTNRRIESSENGRLIYRPLISEICRRLKEAHNEAVLGGCALERAKKHCLEYPNEGKIPQNYCRGVDWFINLKARCKKMETK